MGASRLHRLAEYGQSVWIDFLSRDMLRSGELERRMREDAVVGVTSNPTIYDKAIGGSANVPSAKLIPSPESFQP